MKAIAGISPKIRTSASNGIANETLILSVAKRTMTVSCSNAAKAVRSKIVAPPALGWSVISVLLYQLGCGLTMKVNRPNREPDDEWRRDSQIHDGACSNPRLGPS